MYIIGPIYPVIMGKYFLYLLILRLINNDLYIRVAKQFYGSLLVLRKLVLKCYPLN